MSDQLWEIGGPQPPNWRFSADWFQDAAAAEPVFVVGASDPAVDWPRLHPGPLNAATGFRELSATIRFEATRAEADGWHVLEVEGKEGSGPCPDLEIDVNGRRGLLLPLAQRHDRQHAPWPPSPTAGVIDRALWLPPGCVVEGDNRLVITTVAAERPDPAELRRQQRPDLTSWFGSTLQWHRLALRAAAAPAEPRVTVTMLPLYVRDGAGGVDELADVLIENVPDVRDASVDVRIGPNESRHDVAGREFGDVRLRCRVPEFTGPAQAAVTVRTHAGVHNVTTEVEPARKWTVHLLPHVHLDIGYTDAQAKVIELHSRNVDKAVGIVRDHAGYAFSIDGSFVVEQFLRSRGGQRAEDAMRALRAGRLSVNAFWALLLSGVAGLEDLYRALYFSARLRREHGIAVDYANLTDVPSYTSALPSVLAAAGIDAFMGISNHTRGGNADSDTLHLLSPVRWSGPDGADVLAFFADCYSQLRFVCADPPTVAGMAQGLPALLRRYERPDYLPSDLPLVGTHADNEDLSHGYADVVGRWNAHYEWPKLRFSTVADYFDAVRPLRDRLPLVGGDGGSYWEDGVGTQARAMAVLRRTQALLPMVEAAATLAAAGGDGLVPDLVALDEAWECVLVGSEHTWTSAHATSRPHSHHSHDQLDWKVARIDRGHRVATDEMRRALSQLAEQITTDAVPSVLVVNAVSWARDVIVDLEIEENQEVVDDGGRVLELDQPGDAVDGLRRVRVKVPELLPFGYRLLPLRRVSGAAPRRVEDVPGTLETPHYLLRLDPRSGAVTSLYHRALGAELLAEDKEWSLGQVLYVTGGGSAERRGLDADEISSSYDYDPTLPLPDLTTRPAAMRTGAIRRTPWGWVITSCGSAPTLPHVDVEVELHDDTDRVDVRVSLDKEPTLAKESVYVAFPFALTEPTVHYDRQQGWVDPATDHKAGACNEWLTIQNAVTVSSDALTVAWSSADAPLFTCSGIVRARWPRSFRAADGTLLSWVMNNYWWTNTPAQQGGHVSLRYAFQPMERYDAAAAGRLGRGLRAPALVSDLLHTDRCDDEPRSLPMSGHLAEVDVPDNVVVSLLAGRTGARVTARVQEIAGRPARVRLRHPAMAGATAPLWAAAATATEDVLEPLSLDADGVVDIDLHAHQVRTICFGGEASRTTHHVHPTSGGQS